MLEARRVEPTNLHVSSVVIVDGNQRRIRVSLAIADVEPQLEIRKLDSPLGEGRGVSPDAGF